MKTPLFKSFTIIKLFGTYDVSMQFDNSVNVFLGENGMGKTTILNIFNCVLQQDYNKLQNLPFEAINLEIKNDIFSFTKNELIEFYRKKKNLKYDSMIDYEDVFGHTFLNYLKRKITIGEEVEDETLRRAVFVLSERYHISPSAIYRDLRTFLLDYNNSIYLKTISSRNKYKNLLYFQKIFSDFIDEFEILYFPTYRRIEEDFEKLDLPISNIETKGKLIQFGMKDVEDSIENTLSNIRNDAISNFNSMTGILINQYLNNSCIQPVSHINEGELRIVLDRIGDKITKKDKDLILKKVNNYASNSTDDYYLMNLIQRLIENYEAHSFYDIQMKKFVNCCNQYLIGKRYVFDESKVDLKIVKNDSKETISIQCLSSGEKQIISLFAKLYLNNKKKFIILFDEPELSLSIEWQRTLLPDIMKTDKCSFLIAVTHSPFIFDNEYDELAKDMSDCVKKVK